METALKILLGIHILTGFTALVAGAVAIITKKGRKYHRSSGTIFFWSMVAVAITAFFISFFKEISFLLLISIFSFYMTYTGYRAIKNKDQKYNLLDWLLVFAGVATAAYMIFSMKIILIVFGIVLTSFALPDLLHYLNVIKPKKNYHLILHISRMMGAYIATFTAFLVVNIHFEPAWMIWLLPTAIGTPVISYFISKYSGKKKGSSLSKSSSHAV